MEGQKSGLEITHNEILDSHAIIYAKFQAAKDGYREAKHLVECIKAELKGITDQARKIEQEKNYFANKHDQIKAGRDKARELFESLELLYQSQIEICHEAGDPIRTTRTEEEIKEDLIATRALLREKERESVV